MKHLSGLDASFLHMETPEMPMHVGGLNLFDLPKNYQGDFHEDVKSHVLKRMHLASVFTKKLALMPLEVANPVWVDDDAVDIDYHVRKIHLPKPGSMAQLEAYVGRLHSSLLDRSRPLWEFYVFEGLASGQAGFYSKIHHAALDGQGAAVMAQALLDISAVAREVPPPKLRRRAPYQPRVGELMSAALRDTANQCWRLVKGIPTGVKAVGGLVRNVFEGQASKGNLSSEGSEGSWSLAPKTPLNVSITNQRVFATCKIDLDEAKLVGKVFEASLNDVVLAICSGALRQWLASQGALPSKSLMAAMPVSLRAEGNTELNNQVSMMRIQLASNISDPLRRLQAIKKNSANLKRTLKSVKSILPTDFPSLGLPWIMSAVVALYGRTRIADKMLPLANVCISNVPGPQMDLYLAGAKMATNYPVSIVAHGMALNITVQSYAGALDFGMIACRQAMPDIANFAGMLEAAHQQLLDLAREKIAEAGQADQEAAPAKAPTLKKSSAVKTTAKKAPSTKPAAKAEAPKPANVPVDVAVKKKAPKKRLAAAVVEEVVEEVVEGEVVAEGAVEIVTAVASVVKAKKPSAPKAAKRVAKPQQTETSELRTQADGNEVAPESIEVAYETILVTAP